MRNGIRILACLALVACLVMPGLAMAKKGKKGKRKGLGPGGVPALRDQVVDIHTTVLGLEARLAALEGLAIDDEWTSSRRTRGTATTPIPPPTPRPWSSSTASTTTATASSTTCPSRHRLRRAP